MDDNEESKQIRERIRKVTKYAVKLSQDFGEGPEDVLTVLMGSAIYVGRLYWDHPPGELQDGLHEILDRFFVGEPDEA